jgi:hypothetical protein
MTSKKDLLTDKQYHINQRSATDTIAANDWLAALGLDSDTFGTTHIRLLQAQQQAHLILTHHKDLLTYCQLNALEHFQQLMAHKKTRSKLKPQAANPVLNISTKINRRLFKQHRQLTQA